MTDERQPDSPDVHGWQPIETAPKDGIEIDLWCVNISRGSNGKMRFPCMSWDGKRWEDWHDYILEPKWRPTHWMAPPEPPVLS